MRRLNPMMAMNRAKKATMIHALIPGFELFIAQVTPFCRAAGAADAAPPLTGPVGD